MSCLRFGVGDWDGVGKLRVEHKLGRWVSRRECVERVKSYDACEFVGLEIEGKSIDMERKICASLKRGF